VSWYWSKLWVVLAMVSPILTVGVEVEASTRGGVHLGDIWTQRLELQGLRETLDEGDRSCQPSQLSHREIAPERLGHTVYREVRCLRTYLSPGSLIDIRTCRPSVWSRTRSTIPRRSNRAIVVPIDCGLTWSCRANAAVVVGP
jgi:hypothetical protein